jgi:hypothetical protein
MIYCMFSENVLSSLEIIFEPRDGRHWERSFDQAFVLASRDLASHQLVLVPPSSTFSRHIFDIAL